MSLTSSRPAPLIVPPMTSPKVASAAIPAQKTFQSFGGQSMGFGGIRPPQNTPADTPPINPSAKIVGSKRPITALKGRNGFGYPVTPGNTPSSLERITRRIASNLMGETGEKNDKVDSYQSKIAPSYERRFDTGMRDLDLHFAQNKAKSPPPSPPGARVRAGSKVEWPQSFGAVTTTNRSSDTSVKVTQT